MVDVLENPRHATPTPHPLRFAPELQQGKAQFGGSSTAQAAVDSHFGASKVTSDSIHIAPLSEIVPYTDNGCMVVKGKKSDATYDQLQAAGTEALNKPTPPGAPGPQNQTEQDLADRVVQNTQRQPNESEDEQSDKIADLQKPFAHLDKEQTQRVIDAANKKLESSGFKYSQTEDGAVWLGYKQNDGSYKATMYMRPPECSVG